MSAENVPKGYRLQEGGLMNTLYNDAFPGESFYLIERSFDEVNAELKYPLTRLIKHFYGVNPAREVKILDAGGGIDAKTAREVGLRFKDKVRITSIDLCGPEGQLTNNVRGLRADVLNHDFQGEQFDLVYSNQFLPHISRFQGYLRLSNYLKSVVNPLAPSGIAILHENWFSSDFDYKESVKTFTELCSGLSDEGIELIHTVKGNSLCFGRSPLNPQSVEIVNNLPYTGDIKWPAEAVNRSFSKSMFKGSSFGEILNRIVFGSNSPG